MIARILMNPLIVMAMFSFETSVWRRSVICRDSLAASEATIISLTEVPAKISATTDDEV